ncbi:AMP-binding protein [Thiopseudomonas alkaliphila]|uniref:AMP-binding protein n=1 Tax=Thiopseudomonas alkaliphila TaxID=1697053 RepID=UPI0035711C73
MSLPSYTCGPQDKPLLAMTIGEAFDQTVARFPEREAIVAREQDLRMTWTELSELVNKSARALLALNIKPGDRVGIWSPNCVQWLVTQFATAKVGAILVNINPAYRTNELEYALKQSGCAWLISAASFKSSDYHAMISDLLPELAPAAPGKLESPRLPQLRGVISLSDHPAPGMIAWQTVLSSARTVTDEQLVEVSSKLQFDEPINIQYTSGTTGFPKGATLSHYNILNNGYMVGESLGLTEHDRMVIPVPLYHCFGMVMGNLGALTHGSTIIYPSAAFDPVTTLRTVAEEKATVLYGVPTMFIAMLDSEERPSLDLTSLRTGIMAGSICPIEVMKRVISEMNMKEVQIAYGMTETSPVSTQTAKDDDLERRTTTVGRTQPNLETKIVNEEGQIVPRGEIGELCTRGYSVMLGYWNNPDATKEAIDEARWMHTGDLATMDDEGYVKIVGRNKDMIIRGGENIYPREIEEFLYTHECVADVQVVGVPCKKFGEEIVAWVQLHPGDTVTEDELKEYCKGKIAHFKVPRYIKFVDEFPMTISGKIQKFRMREISMEELGIEAP